MGKMIKTTDTSISIDTFSIMAVKIGDFTFEVREMFPWIEVYSEGDTGKDLVTEIDDDNLPTFVESEEGYEDLKRICLNWYFNNVEIVKDIEPVETENNEEGD